MRKPLIGVLPLYDPEKESYWMLPGYMKGVEAAGGIPVMLPLTTNFEVIQSLAESFDGFLFTGGQDMNPNLYGEKKESFCGELCEERDQMEELLFKLVLELDKPTFGICRGVQLFNSLLGGTLYQDIPTQFRSKQQVLHKQQPPYTVPAHLVSIEKGNALYRIVKTESLRVNSYHHQGIKKLSEQLTSVAEAEDGLTEAVHMPGKSFVLAVQWHPEFNYHLDNHSFKLFSAFVDQCKRVSV
ncbi:gamma-glutamyl-gamma-aminobutyrate hydrolase family protein [Mesobacillus maritimus]|uniref:Gamma-glutamyl-gamma-aminobutyrate hydrolase family protein n=1 Tax=Mesobacillus maritimus TaxID=1643336 RepID=A0ABS7K881_9BACI|nr:gamma-glutamyl-gamma-aminobutyrate hydrolase family protein [Mesobacillus maritimus]MBY0098477.1 gamma-glutamyl-gamma-aminobutyrate hydrolase family protein [Mesobacillus maritimus]